MGLKIRFVLVLLLGFSLLHAQELPPNNWFNMDSGTENYPGVSIDKTYETLLKGKNSQTVVVAVIDGGVDYQHEDLKSVMWVNEDEIPGNGIDDDKNGYIDDIHGWNFIGGKDGNVGKDNLEVTRIYAKLRKKYKDVGASAISNKEKKDYELYQTVKKEVEPKRENAANQLDQIKTTSSIVNASLEAVDKALDGKELSIDNLNALEVGTDRYLMIGKEILIQTLADQPATSIKAILEDYEEYNAPYIDYYSRQLYLYNPDLDPRPIVGDNYADSSERYYGNNDVKGPNAGHGTHVAGIIAAVRDNDLGIRGVANNVRIMSVRTVPDGDERDKDVANAIRYAVDNGASIINMSFGKGYSWDKNVVDKAVKYAMKKDVLLVHAAGNDKKNSDLNDNFPNDKFEKKGLFGPKRAKNWISVGALTWKGGEDAIAEFSNYGKEEVDVFSPGYEILSTKPEDNYEHESGTSMAAPVTSGVAAVIRSYFPTLTALQVKEIILQSTVKQNHKVIVPGSDTKKSFSEMCKTGGVVNAFEAVKLASKTKGKKKGGSVKASGPKV